jgi:cytochrome c-type biogenesis protein CcmH/NrfG
MADDYSVLYAITTLYVQQQKWKEADIFARQMLRLNPKSAEVEQLVEYIRQNKGE